MTEPARVTPSTQHYPSVDANPDFAKIEEQVLSCWKSERTFEQSVEARDRNNEYVFYDGPPFANGLPHYGHLLTGYVKDLFARYHTMKGQRVERRFGWDCHGLPAEMGAEKELQISGRQQITDYGIGNFNDYCRSNVMRYAHEWERYVDRQARWVDFKDDYKTMDTDFMESVLWAFKQLYDKGLIFEAHRVMAYSWAAQTPLSNFETKLDNSYRSRTDKAVTVKFRLKERPEGAPEAQNYYLLAWTTTPWTLPSNLALAVNPKTNYACLTKDGDAYISAWNGTTPGSLGSHIKDLGVFQVRWHSLQRGVITLYFDGKFLTETRPKNFVSVEEDTICDLHEIEDGKSFVGLQYEPLFPYFTGTPNAFRVLDGSSFIEAGSGTGIVHMAPGFGEDDQRVCAENEIEVIVPVDEAGRYTDAIYDLGTLVRNPRAGGDPQTHGSEQAAIDPRLRGGYGNVVVETKRLSLRPFTSDEFALYEQIETDDAITSRMAAGGMDATTRQAEFARFLSDQKQRGYSMWGVFLKDSGTFIGRAGFDHRDFNQPKTNPERIELRYAMLGDYWGKGYTRELAEALMRWAADNTSADEVDAGTFSDNDASLKILKALGFTHRQVVHFNNKEIQYFVAPLAPLRTGSDLPALSLRGLNVVADKNKRADEPYTDSQLEKYGLANLRIIDWLKQTGHLVKQEDYTHNYPHCWRTDTPLIYRALPSWYVKVTTIRDRAVELNRQINWIPEHIGDGQMGHMLATAPDWSISRNRFWGTPIPIWRREGSDELKVFGSIAELETFFVDPHSARSASEDAESRVDDRDAASRAACGNSGAAECETGWITDLHRPFIDALTLARDGSRWQRVTDVFDCWFESGSMPFAQVHYPFENKDWFHDHFPADFITEYVGQTRGWFNTLIILATALFDKPPFKNCICHGVVLDSETGLKYSKRLKNYKDPLNVIDQFGADALRWLMVSSPVMRGHDLMVDPEGKFIRDVVRLHIKPIWNAYNFFTLYANADGVKARFDTSSKNLMDRYILAKCGEAVAAIDRGLDAYDSPSACGAVSDFFEVLNNWYIRRNRDRFWSGGSIDADKQAAYDTLYTVLTAMCRAAAPLLPLTLDAIYRGLTGDDSVHLAEFPMDRDFPRDLVLVADMDKVRNACTAALSVRAATNIRTRQPLASASLYGAGADRLQPFADLIRDEVNVKDVVFSTDLAAVSNYKLQVFPPVIGKRLPHAMKQIIPAAKQGNWELKDGALHIVGEVLIEGEYELALEPKSAVSGAAPLAGNDALIVLDISITPVLAAEGTARDFVRLVQQARKDADLNISDRISLTYDAPAATTQAIATHADYISEQVLATAVMAGNSGKHRFEQPLEGESVRFAFDVTR